MRFIHSTRFTHLNHYTRYACYIRSSHYFSSICLLVLPAYLFYLLTCSICLLCSTCLLVLSTWSRSYALNILLISSYKCTLKKSTVLLSFWRIENVCFLNNSTIITVVSSKSQIVPYASVVIIPQTTNLQYILQLSP